MVFNIFLVKESKNKKICKEMKQCCDESGHSKSENSFDI